MKKVLYVIVDRKGEMLIHTLRYFRKDSIDCLMERSDIPWRYLTQKHGWKCVKMNVEFNPYL